MSKKNQKKVQFESGRIAGQMEVLSALCDVARHGLDSFRTCHSGCFERSIVDAVREEMKKRLLL